MIVPLVLFGFFGISESNASCIAGEIRLDDSKYSSQHLVIGKDVLHVSGKLVNLVNQTRDILLTISSSDIRGFQTCGSPRIYLPLYSNDHLPDYKKDGIHFEKISGTFENISLKPNGIKSYELSINPLKSGTYNLRTVALTDSYVNVDGGMTIIVRDMAPLKQITSGIAPEKIICNEGLKLISKSSDNSIVCVKPSTVEKLIQRGWTR